MTVIRDEAKVKLDRLAIQREYRSYMRTSIEVVRKIHAQRHRVADTRGVRKADLVTDILISSWGAARVRAAFE